MIEIGVEGGGCLSGIQCSLDAVVESCVWNVGLLYAAIILFLVGHFSGEGIKLKRPILVGLPILVGKNIGLGLLWARIQVVSGSILWDLGLGVHDFLVLVHGSESLGDVGMEGGCGGVVDCGRGITGGFK